MAPDAPPVPKARPVRRRRRRVAHRDEHVQHRAAEAGGDGHVSLAAGDGDVEDRNNASSSSSSDSCSSNSSSSSTSSSNSSTTTKSAEGSDDNNGDAQDAPERVLVEADNAGIEAQGPNASGAGSPFPVKDHNLSHSVSHNARR